MSFKIDRPVLVLEPRPRTTRGAYQIGYEGYLGRVVEYHRESSFVLVGQPGGPAEWCYRGRVFVGPEVDALHVMHRMLADNACLTSAIAEYINKLRREKQL